MEFRIDPTPLSRRRGRGILAATAVVAVVLAAVVGVLASGNTRPIAVVAAPSSTARPAAVLGGSDTGHPSAQPSASAPATKPAGAPPRIVCHGVANGRCRAIALAALGASIDPALPMPTKVDVWASLLCGSVFDCPPDRMTGRQAAGSAVVVAGTVGLWVNVLAPAATTGAATFDAWVIRSGPIG